jgi:hypothetical protein
MSDETPKKPSDPVRPQCVGEKCTMCGAQATHKVAEEFQFDEPMPQRHPLTAYVCGWCFGSIMGYEVRHIYAGSAPPGPPPRGFKVDADEPEVKPWMGPRASSETELVCVVCGKADTPSRFGSKVMPDGSDQPCHTGCLFSSLFAEDAERIEDAKKTRFSGVRFHGRCVGRRA